MRVAHHIFWRGKFRPGLATRTRGRRRGFGSRSRLLDLWSRGRRLFGNSFFSLSRLGLFVAGFRFAERRCFGKRHVFDIAWIVKHSRLLVDATGVTRRMSPAGGMVIRL